MSEPSLRDLTSPLQPRILGDLPSDDTSTASSPGQSLASSMTFPSSTTSRSSKPARPYRFRTQCATVENPDPNHRDQWGSSAVPIYQSATFKGVGNQYDYTRSGNPTRTFLEHHIAKISSARHAYALTSGMGALDIILRLLQAGDEIIAGNDLYGGSNRLLTYLKTHNNITTHHISTTDPNNFLPYLKPDSRVRMVLLETPTNPLLQIADLAGISNLVHRHIPDCLVVVDNTMMTSYLQRPLEHGADIVYDSATKYLSGHHDLMAGAVICNRDDLAKRLYFVINSVGNGLMPFDSFLLLRGIKTLALRMDQQQETACRVATYLDKLGFKVLFPALASHPGRTVHGVQARGPGAVLSFITGDQNLSERIVGATRLWGISVSFGCVNSLISMPCLMSHASIDPAIRAARNLPEDLIRLCVGIEDADDLLDDLESALLEARAIEVAEDGRIRRVSPPSTSPTLHAVADQLDRLKVDGAVPGSLVVSAPGKVILFGEHAVVHGVTAVAGSVDLRCYGLLEPRFDDSVGLSLPDLGLDHVWKVSDLPWDQVAAADIEQPESSPDAELVLKLAELAGQEGKVASRAAQAFLYLYLRLAKRDNSRCRTFTVRSALPIGAGLGSSAALSVCIASALLYGQGHLPVPHEGNHAHHGRISFPSNHVGMVNAWAFVAEKINHGNPSGVDNAVAAHGGAIAFKRPASLEPLHGFKSLRFLLTDTLIPRETMRLVAAVGALKASEPDYVESILAAIQDLSDEARRCLLDTEMDRKEQIGILSSLIEQNHAHLVSLGVSHPSLEAVKVKAESCGLATKLTGAGGGGVAVSLIPDDFSEEQLARLKSELASDGFRCYETKVGGGGLGLHILTEEATRVKSSADGGADVVPHRTRLVAAQPADLADWANSLGDDWYLV